MINKKIFKIRMSSTLTIILWSLLYIPAVSWFHENKIYADMINYLSFFMVFLSICLLFSATLSRQVLIAGIFIIVPLLLIPTIDIINKVFFILLVIFYSVYPIRSSGIFLNFYLTIIIVSLVSYVTNPVVYYPNSNKLIILTWNPNIYWMYLVFLTLSVSITSRSARWHWTAFITSNLYAGGSRASLVLVLLSWLAKFRFVLPLGMLASLVFLFILPFSIYFDFWDELLSYRLSLLFNVVRQFENSGVSDMPLLEIMYTPGWPILFAVSLFVMFSYAKIAAVYFILLFALVMDSTATSPFIVAVCLGLVSNLITTNLKQKEKGLHA